MPSATLYSIFSFNPLKDPNIHPLQVHKDAHLCCFPQLSLSPSRLRISIRLWTNYTNQIYFTPFVTKVKLVNLIEIFSQNSSIFRIPVTQGFVWHPLNVITQLCTFSIRATHSNEWPLLWRFCHLKLELNISTCLLDSFKSLTRSFRSHCKCSSENKQEASEVVSRLMWISISPFVTLFNIWLVWHMKLFTDKSQGRW